MSAKPLTIAAAPAFALPVLFLGYAVVANYEFITGLGRDIAEMPKSATEYLNGEAAIQIDTYYKKIMPHRLPSIDAMGAARYLAFREGRPGVVVGEDGWLFSKEEFEATLKRTPDLAEAAAGVVAVRDQLAAKGIELVVVPLPAKADIYREHVSYPAIPTDLERLYEDFRTVLDNAGIKTVESRAPLLEAKDKGQLFLTTDTHWTPLGAEVVADAVGSALGKGDAAYSIADTAPVQREGDLSKFIVTVGRRHLRALLNPVRADRHQLQRQPAMELRRKPQGRARRRRAEPGRRGQGAGGADARPARQRHAARYAPRSGDLGVSDPLSRPDPAVERRTGKGGGAMIRPLLTLAAASLALAAGLAVASPANAATCMVRVPESLSSDSERARPMVPGPCKAGQDGAKHRVAKPVDPLKLIRNRMIAGKNVSYKELLKLADSGDDLAQLNLAKRIEADNDPATLDAAARYYRRAAENGRNSAVRPLIRLLNADVFLDQPKNLAASRDLLEKLAAKGDPVARDGLIAMYRAGKPFGPDPARADELLVAAAEGGDAKAAPMIDEPGLQDAQMSVAGLSDGVYFWRVGVQQYLGGEVTENWTPFQKFTVTGAGR